MDSQLKNRRRHNILLFSRLLQCKENASPFTLIVDTLAQSGKPLLQDILQRAKASNLGVIYVSFETLRKPNNADVFLDGGSHSSEGLQRLIASFLGASTRHLLIFDSLNPLLSRKQFNVASFLSSFISPTVSLLAVHHSDVPVSSFTGTCYGAHPVMMLHYLATTILTVHSITHVISRKQAQDRSRSEPRFGLAEETEGVIVGLGSNDSSGMVIEMEYRRRSGRGVKEWFFLPDAGLYVSPQQSSTTKGTPRGPHWGLILLEDHPQYSSSTPTPTKASGTVDFDSTFSLELTDKQRKEREGIVLPYFDAQREEGAGEGGRILYEMGAEDDFDEEEDEI